MWEVGVGVGGQGWGWEVGVVKLMSIESRLLPSSRPAFNLSQHQGLFQ